MTTPYLLLCGEVVTVMAKIDVNAWKEFVVGKLFGDDKFVKPPVLHNRQVRPDEYGIPYVVRTKFNNGISGRVAEVDGVEPSPAGVISWGAENATFFHGSVKYFV